MDVYTMTSTYQIKYKDLRAKKKTVAFVPTMGALHEGHLSLMQYAKETADVVVASIFVNPTQFNDPNDLFKYPRPLDRDIHLLEKAGIQILFLPTENEIYPPDIDLHVDLDFGSLMEVMEGAHRPGHFDGVVMVVNRLLDLVKPDYIIMGQKDLQQLQIIRKMIGELNLPVQLIGHPIVREASGLAMSSRNLRIAKDLRPKANLIYQSLDWARQNSNRFKPWAIEAEIKLRLEQAGFGLEYFEIVDEHTLLPISDWHESRVPIACVAAWLGDVRLIDNMALYDQRA